MARTAEVKRDARIGEAEARADSQIKEAIAEEERLAARLVNDIEIAKAQRDFELKKAAYDQEVQAKVRIQNFQIMYNSVGKPGCFFFLRVEQLCWELFRHLFVFRSYNPGMVVFAHFIRVWLCLFFSFLRVPYFLFFLLLPGNYTMPSAIIFPASNHGGSGKRA